MGTYVERELDACERSLLPRAQHDMAVVGQQGCSTRFTFFAAFDGTNNAKDNLKLSGDSHPTNIAHLFKQADQAAQDSPYLFPRYYPGVGTGGEQGGLLRAGLWPTPAIDATAEKAYVEFSDAAQNHLQRYPLATPLDIGVAVTGFSRGATTGLRFAQLVHARGLVAPDGTVLAPPGSVPVTAMALIDPVATFVKGPTHLPPNVVGQVLVVQAIHEDRSDFRPLNFAGDPRVTTVHQPGNHVGVGGGYDAHGSAANVLEGVTGYFRNRGMGIAPVSAAYRHDPDQPQLLRTETWQTARNGEALALEDGALRQVWRVDGSTSERMTVQPQMPEEHQQWLRQAWEALTPGLSSYGRTQEECRQAAAACVCAVACYGAIWPPREFRLSHDGERICVLHGNGVPEVLSVAQALETSALHHQSLAIEARAMMRGKLPGVAHQRECEELSVDRLQGRSR